MLVWACDAGRAKALQIIQIIDCWSRWHHSPCSASTRPPLFQFVKTNTHNRARYLSWEIFLLLNACFFSPCLVGRCCQPAASLRPQPRAAAAEIISIEPLRWYNANFSFSSIFTPSWPCALQEQSQKNFYHRHHHYHHHQKQASASSRAGSIRNTLLGLIFPGSQPLNVSLFSSSYVSFIRASLVKGRRTPTCCSR